jgi:phage tail sheath gpL-like
MSISTAIGANRLSRVSGYKLKKGFFNDVTPNLPQMVAMLGEANTANQGTLVQTPTQITSAAQAGQLYGYGSPIHMMARILFPFGTDGIGLPVFVLPQLEAVGATATVIVLTVTGTATANTTHFLNICGRENLDGKPYSYSVAIGDTPTIIAGKMRDAVNAVLGCPFIATSSLGVVTLTTKWKSVTSADVTATPDNNLVPAGINYAITSNTPGAGLADISGALAQFENTWYTTVINPYGPATFAALEALNGIPDDNNPTGRYQPTIFKPFMAFYGSTLNTVAAIIAITNAAGRVNQVTNVHCPAPSSSGMPFEAAANMVALFCPIMQNTPHLDVSGKSYPDMPVPNSNVIGEMSQYNNRDLLVQAGSSTVTLRNGVYQVQDLVTTYATVGEVPLEFNWCRNLNLDWNVKDGYSILESIHVKDKTIVADNLVVSVDGVIKPKEWKGTLFEYFDYLEKIALINDAAFSKSSLTVGISNTNPKRLETAFRYKRTSTTTIQSTDVQAGF